MIADLLQEGAAAGYMLAAVLYLLLIRGIERYLAKREPPGEMQQIARLAGRQRCSEYAIFSKAAEDWNFSPAKVDIDFKAYLLEGHIPFYVKDFVRKSQERLDRCGGAAGKESP